MKQLKFLAFGAAALLMASCSQEELTGSDGHGDGAVTFRVNLPDGGFGTRSFGDGLTANKLQYAVFEVNGTTPAESPLFTGEADFGNSLSTTLSLNLINGRTYQIAFFAQSSQSIQEEVYAFDGNTISVSYDKMTSDGNNADAYDCFYNVDTYAITSATTTQNVTLTRPVAQLNWGANDINANQQIADTYGATGQYVNTSVSLTIPTTFNLSDGTLTGDAKAVELGEFSIPVKESYPVNPSVNQYLAINYILAGTTSTVYTLTLNVSNDNENPSVSSEAEATTNTVDVANAPLQANYRTNIYGALLSNSASFDISKDNIFGGDNDEALPWDGKTVTYPTVINNTVAINRPSDLAGLAALVSGRDLPEGQTQSDFAGKTITINTDIDLGGEEFPGIGYATRSSSTGTGAPFRGTFDGGNHTISNVKISYTEDNSSTCVGFIPQLDGTGVLQNVTFEGLVINGGAAEQAGVVGIVTNGAKVSNVKVSSGTVTCAETSGGIVGRMIATGTIDGCSNGASVSGTSKVGGIVGAAYYNSKEAMMTISDCHNTGAVHSYGPANRQACVAGGIVGESCANVTGCTNSGTISGDTGEVGGIVGWQFMSGTISGCTNSGTITSQGSIIGGIVGNISYSNTSDAYPLKSTIEVDGNSNTGAITGSGEVSGIVGRFNSPGICQNNTNSAPSLTATNGVVAGIIGYVLGGDVTVYNNVNNTTTENMTGNPICDLYNGTVIQK